MARIAEDANWNPKRLEKQLKNIYYAAGDTGAFGGANRLFQRAHELGIPATRKDVEQFLSKQLTYTIHKPAKHKFKRNKTYAAQIDQQWQADLADMQKVSKSNEGMNYILTCIDVLSRYAWAVPVRSKSKKDMLTAFKELFRLAKPRKPQRLQTDKGTEFFNDVISGFLRGNGVHHFASNSDTKAAIVERFNRTLKQRMFAYFTANNTRRYTDVLGDFVYAYNNSNHRSINMRPVDVDNEDAAHRAWRALYYDTGSGVPSAKKQRLLEPNQKVRIARWKGHFEKGYTPNWSREHFTVRKGIKNPLFVYKIEDAAGEPIEGNFYGAELQAIPRNKKQVERVLQTRGRGTAKEALVQWRGWPEKFNEWIPHSDLAKHGAGD